MIGMIARYLTMSMAGHQKRFPKPRGQALEPLTPTLTYLPYFEVTDRSVFNTTRVFELELVDDQWRQLFASMRRHSIHIERRSSSHVIIFSCTYKELLYPSRNRTDLE